MRQTDWTPGPWKLSSPVTAGYAAKVFTDCGRPVADIHRMITDEREQGNARLIAKSPEMAELLQRWEQHDWTDAGERAQLGEATERLLNELGPR